MNTSENSTVDAGGVRDTAKEAYARAKEEVRSVSEDAKERAAAFAETQKSQVSESLDQFAKAIEKAGDELEERDQTMAGQVVRQAADSLGQLSRSIGQSSAPELLDSVRAFGRNNPAAFIGGAVLAGIALGRFARAAPRTETPRAPRPAPERPQTFAAAERLSAAPDGTVGGASPRPEGSR